MNKYGLVLAGGGAKGAYQLGAWNALREMSVSFNAVAGTSIGSINGAFIAADMYNEAIEFWKSAEINNGVNITEELKDPDNLFSLKNFSSLFKEVLKNKGIDASPTKELLLRFIDEEKVRRSDVKFGMVTFHLSEFTPLHLFTKDIPQGELVDYLLASAKVPLASKIGPEGERFLDGGVYDNAPIEMLRNNGYNKLIVIDISNISGLGHRLDLSCVEMIYIRPYDIEDLGAAFDFSDVMFEKRVKMGYLDTKKAFGYLSGRRYYFDKDVFRKMAEKYGAEACLQLEEIAHELEMEKLIVYDEDTFIRNLKLLSEEYKREQELRQVAEEEKENTIVNRIKKKYSELRTSKGFSEGIALLDSIII